MRAQIAQKQRDIRLNQLTISELDGLPSGTRVYEGVGKMYVFSFSFISFLPLKCQKSGKRNKKANDFLCLNCVDTRFVLEDLKQVKKRLEKEKTDLGSDVTDLGKKLHYLETTFQKTQENIQAILQRGA